MADLNSDDQAETTKENGEVTSVSAESAESSAATDSAPTLQGATPTDVTPKSDARVAQQSGIDSPQRPSQRKV